MAKREKRDFGVVSIRLEPELKAALAEFADGEGKTVSETARELLWSALKGEGVEFAARDLRDVGRAEGRSEGLRELYAAVREVTERFRRR